MANKEAPNTLLSNSIFKVLDLVCEGPISGFVRKPGPYSADPLLSTYYDDVPVRNEDGSYNYNITGTSYSFDYTRGGSDQTGILGYQKVESIIPLSSNTRIANPPVGAGPYKQVTASFSTNTYPDADSVKVTVRVPSLFAQDDEGNTNPFELTYAVDISVNHGTWVPQGSITIRGKCTAPYLKTTTYQLPKTYPPSTYYEWKVRVRRVSQNIMSIRTQNEIFVDSISVISSTLFAYPNSVLVGTQIGAEQFASIPSRAYEIAGLLLSVPSGYEPTSYGFTTEPVTIDTVSYNVDQPWNINVDSPDKLRGMYVGLGVTGLAIPPGSYVTFLHPQGPDYYFSINNSTTSALTGVPVTIGYESASVTTPARYPNVWLGNFVTGVWSDNPAWVFYDLLTNPVHGLGDYIQSSAVDKWSLYRIAQYCDEMVDDGDGGLEPRFTCNVVIQQPQEAYTVLLNLASVFRGMLYYANGTIHASQNQDDPPVYAFTNANVVDGVFNYSDTARNTRSTVAVVKWVDPDNGYRENVEYVEDTEGVQRYGYIEKQMTAFATTSPGQAYRLGSWTLQTERLLTETVTFQSSLEGLAIQPGDSFAIYDNFRTNRSQGGRVVAFDSTRSLITLDRPVVIESGLTYSLSAIIPKFQLDGTGDLTGSNQIDLIRQSQVETFQVVTPPASTASQLLISGSFSTGLFVGSTWLLAASGLVNSPQNAAFYTCLATAEIEPGKIEVLGLQANTGINFSIQTGYTTATYPTNSGDPTPILPPSNLQVTSVTGATADNTFYSAISLTWLNTPSADLSYYVVSGKEWDTAYERFTVLDTGFNFTRNDTGQYLFKVAAVSNGGVESTFITGGILIGTLNPLGTLRSLSGVRLVQNADPLYVNGITGYTGYVGINPGFQWTIPVDSRGQQIVDAEFISGYRVSAKSFDGNVTYYTTQISGNQNTTFQFTGDLLRTFQGTPRGFNFDVQTIDFYGNVVTGANLHVDNPPMKAPFSSGFVGFNGGVIYNVTPSIQYDTSGIFLWVNQSPSFTPTFSNYNFTSTNLAGTASIAPQTGVFWTWFALADSFNATGNRIFGPISGNTNGIIGQFSYDISADISGAFSLLTGMITQETIARTGADYQNLLLINGLSGQVTGLPGVVNTALNARVQTAVVSSSGALATTIDAVSARVQLTGQQISATVGTLQSALATTGGALATWVTQLGAVTSGNTATVKLMADAFATGQVNGTGGAAVARWGFELDTNGKIVSMKATSASFGSSYGTIVLGNADLQSSTYVQGSAGWKLSADGNLDANKGAFRGSVYVSSGESNQIILDGNGITFGVFAGDNGQASLHGDIISLIPTRLSFTDSDGDNTASIGNDILGGGSVSIYNKAPSENVVVHAGGLRGDIQLTGGLFVGSTVSTSSSPMSGPLAIIRGSDGKVSGRALQVRGDAFDHIYMGTVVPTWSDSLTEHHFGVVTQARCAAGFVDCASDSDVIGRYDWDNSTSTSGNFKVRKLDGSAFNGTYRFSYLLIDNA